MNQDAKIFKAISDPKRIAILYYLKQGTKCACEISEYFNLAQSKLSYHMKILCETGFVKSTYVGKWTHYTLDKEGCRQAQEILTKLLEIEE